MRHSIAVTILILGAALGGPAGAETRIERGKAA